ncbi:hypothetical protein I603_2785 [Erythrobacter dokdonensis DSW-74]|uniref:Uncharacterized protein n=1 Tax=Erythrobacter dokdonensis DSW-74 TaxID=1300349 RepID=A0A1A7BBL6_9SPHN|nr:hypothetical protein I603_2785 [Erythrobacter dokdonensis DSW-74]
MIDRQTAAAGTPVKGRNGASGPISTNRQRNPSSRIDAPWMARMPSRPGRAMRTFRRRRRNEVLPRRIGRA